MSRPPSAPDSRINCPIPAGFDEVTRDPRNNRQFQKRGCFIALFTADEIGMPGLEVPIRDRIGHAGFTVDPPQIMRCGRHDVFWRLQYYTRPTGNWIAVINGIFRCPMPCVVQINATGRKSQPFIHLRDFAEWLATVSISANPCGPTSTPPAVH